MHVLRPVTVLFALTASSVSVHARAHRHKRALIDTCANVDADLGLLGLFDVNLKLCLCISALPTLISTNAQLQAAANILGIPAVTAVLTALVKAAIDVQTCTFPDHAVPQCSSNPCNFTCTDGFRPEPPSNPTACVCDGIPCNGICGTTPCSSQMAKRAVEGWKHTTCLQGWSTCGIWGGARGDYECVDVRRDLWSCGGCGVPLRATDPTGIDCTAIPGVLDVACLSSRCVVHRCKEGFHVSPDKATCISNPTDPADSALILDGEVHYRSWGVSLA